MTLDDVLTSFHQPGDLPRAEMQWALDHWDEASPRFTALLDAYASGEGRTTAADNTLFVTLHLQAEKGDAAAFAPLCRLLRDGEAAYAVLGDAIGVTLARVLVSAYDGHLPMLATVVETVQTDDFVRETALQAMAYLTRAGQVPEEAMRAHLLRWLDGLPQEESHIWAAWVMAVANLGYADLAGQAEELFRRGFVDPDWTDVEDFRADLQRTLDDPAGLVGFAHDEIGPFGSALDELEGFTNIAAPDRTVVLDEDELEDFARTRLRDWTSEPEGYGLQQTITNPLRGVGRNDPCPCGSGKKHKKCCLV